MSVLRTYHVPGPAPEDRVHGVTESLMSEVWSDLVHAEVFAEGDLIEIEAASLRMALRSVTAKMSVAADMCAALKGIQAIRPFNWDDGDDPRLQAAYAAVDAAIVRAEGGA